MRLYGNSASRVGMDVAQEERANLKVKLGPVRSRARLWLWTGAFLFILGGLAFGYTWYSAPRIVWGVSVKGQTLGGMLPQEAVSALAARLNAFESSTIELVSGSRRWTTSPQELGVAYDIEAT